MSLNDKDKEFTQEILQQLKELKFRKLSKDEVNNLPLIGCYSVINLIDAIEALHQEIEKQQAQAAKMREALKLIAGYSKKKCFAFIKDIAEEALTSDTGKDYHNPADVEALKQAREALEITSDCRCRVDSECTRCEALAAIDKVLGGKEDER